MLVKERQLSPKELGGQGAEHLQGATVGRCMALLAEPQRQGLHSVSQSLPPALSAHHPAEDLQVPSPQRTKSTYSSTM